LSRVAPNPYSPFADADPQLRHLFPVPAFISVPPVPGSLALTGCSRLAMVPWDVTEAPAREELPEGTCPLCARPMREGNPQPDQRPVAACHRCLAPTRHDGLCALCRVTMHEHWQVEQAADAANQGTLDYRAIRREQHPGSVLIENAAALLDDHGEGSRSALAAADMAMPPAQWCRAYGVTILDPDGWRHGNFHPWDAPVTLAEFSRRAAMSTTDCANPAWEGISRDLKAQSAATQPLPGHSGKLAQRPDWLDKPERALTAEEIGTYRLDHCGTCRDAEFYGWSGTTASQAHAEHQETNDVGPLRGTPCRCPKCTDGGGRR